MITSRPASYFSIGDLLDLLPVEAAFIESSWVANVMGFIGDHEYSWTTSLSEESAILDWLTLKVVQSVGVDTLDDLLPGCGGEHVVEGFCVWNKMEFSFVHQGNLTVSLVVVHCAFL